MNKDMNRGIGSFATKAPRQTMIRDEPHMLAYINPQEEQILRDMGGSGEAGPDGIPSYGWLSDTWSEITSGGGAETATYNSDTKPDEDDSYSTGSALGNLGRDLSIGLGLSTPNDATQASFNRRTAETAAANETAKKDDDNDDDDTSYTAPIITPMATLPSPTNAAVEDRPSANFSYGYLPALNSLQSNSLVPAAQPAQPVLAANGERQPHRFQELLDMYEDPYAVGMSQGGSVPKQTMIGDQPHMLAYINPEEEQTLRDMGGSGMPGPGGVPAYHIPPPDELSDIAAHYAEVDLLNENYEPMASFYEGPSRKGVGEISTFNIDNGYGGTIPVENDLSGKMNYYPQGKDGPSFSTLKEANEHLGFGSIQGRFDDLQGKYDPDLIYSQADRDSLSLQDPNLIYSQEQFEANAGDPNLAYTQEQFEANAGDPNLIYSQSDYDANAQDPNLLYTQDQYDANAPDPSLIYNQDQYDANAQDPNLLYTQDQYDANAPDPSLIYNQDQYDANAQDPSLLYTQDQYDAVNDPYQKQTGLYNTQTGLYNDVLGNYDTLQEDYAGKVGELNTQTGLYNTQTDLYDTQTGKYNDLLGTHGDYSDLDYSNLQDKYTGDGGLYTGLQTDYDAQGKLLVDLQTDYDEIEGLYEGVEQDYLNKQVLANSSGLPTSQQNPFRPASINPMQAPGTSNIVMPASYGNAGSYTFQELLDNYVDPYAVDPRGV